MRKILVIGHGNFALGIQSAVGVLTGDPDSITAISTYLDDRDFTPEIQAFIDSVGEEDEGLILTDIYGGSVFQKVVLLCPEQRGGRLGPRGAGARSARRPARHRDPRGQRAGGS